MVFPQQGLYWNKVNKQELTFFSITMNYMQLSKHELNKLHEIHHVYMDTESH